MNYEDRNLVNDDGCRKLYRITEGRVKCIDNIANLLMFLKDLVTYKIVMYNLTIIYFS